MRRRVGVVAIRSTVAQAAGLLARRRFATEARCPEALIRAAEADEDEKNPNLLFRKISEVCSFPGHNAERCMKTRTLPPNTYRIPFVGAVERMTCKTGCATMAFAITSKGTW